MFARVLGCEPRSKAATACLASFLPRSQGWLSWFVLLVQYAGRLHRKHAGKAEVRIYDYVDRAVPMLASKFEKRMTGYRSMGYEVDEKRISESNGTKELTIEYDEPS